MKSWRIALVVAAVVGIAFGATGALAGRYEGPTWAEDSVLAHSTQTYYFWFVGGEYAVVQVAGDGGTDVDVYVYDQDGYLVASDTDRSDWCYVSWYAGRTQRYRVEVRNLGGVWNEYVLTTN
jgi:hypothetical protein